MLETIKRYSIFEDSSILEALERMDKIGGKLLIVVDSSGKYKCLVSIGDIQRAILKKISLNDPVKNIVRPVTKVASVKDDIEYIKKYMIEHRNEFMPVINELGIIEKIVFYKDLFLEEDRQLSSLNLPVVIMAGGMGTRLKPLTNVLPKPLIPINDKTILEHIMDMFCEIGCCNFYLSVNYKAEMIKYYLSTLPNKKYNVRYVEEKIPSGTAGSLSLLKKEINTPFIVTNCDILIEQDISEIYDYHCKNENLLTIVSAIKNYQIPYGTMETKENGVLVRLNEKPMVSYQINTGFYILQPGLLNKIPENTFFHITDLIENLIENGERVGVFPISEGSWKDIGLWSEFIKINKIY